MPVDVTVPLLAAEGQDVHPLGGHDLAQRLGHAMDEPLEGQVFVEGKVACDVLPMLPWRDQGVAVERGILVEEDDRRAVLVDDVVAILGILRDDLADEAGAAL